MFHAPRLGGDAISEHIAARTQDFGPDFSPDFNTAPEPFTFAFDELEVRAYSVEAPVPHYLYVTFGLSRVRSSVPVAGTQTELTMRVPHSGPVPFVWPAEQLATMVASVWRSGNDIAPGHHFTAKNLPGGFLFITDPVLGHIDPPTGIVRFTQALWVTPDELEAALCWDVSAFAQVITEHLPLGVGDGERGSVLGVPSIRKRVDAAALREGSSLGAVEAKILDVDATGRIDLDVNAAKALIRAARYRLRFGRRFALVRNNVWVMLAPDVGFEADETHMQLDGSVDLANEIIATVDPLPGTYHLTAAPVTLHIVGNS